MKEAYSYNFNLYLISEIFLLILLLHCFIAITNAALDLSPVLLGVLFTLLLLCSVIFAKVYCNRASTTMRDLNSDMKQNMNSISYKHDAQKVKLLFYYLVFKSFLKYLGQYFWHSIVI